MNFVRRWFHCRVNFILYPCRIKCTTIDRQACNTFQRFELAGTENFPNAWPNCRNVFWLPWGKKNVDPRVVLFCRVTVERCISREMFVAAPLYTFHGFFSFFQLSFHFPLSLSLSLLRLLLFNSSTSDAVRSQIREEKKSSFPFAWFEKVCKKFPPIRSYWHVCISDQTSSSEILKVDQFQNV